ncbi:MAG: hypothetical protein R2875_17185 [Desulfobacterales bacterium]
MAGKALELDDALKNFYEDLENGGFFTTSSDHETLIAREKPFYDSATPSGNAVVALNLLRLYTYTTDHGFRKRAEKTFKAFYQRLTATPSALSEMMLALDWYFDTPKEIVLITPDSNGAETAASPFLDQFRARFIPNRILVVVDDSQTAALAGMIPLLAGKKTAGGAASAFVCENGTCMLPAKTPEDFAGQLQQ